MLGDLQDNSVECNLPPDIPDRGKRSAHASQKKPSHIPIFPDAYLRDNYRLTLEQHGMFLMLMFEAWNSDDCTLPDDDKVLAGYCNLAVAKFRKISAPVLAKWTSENGRIYQKRLLKEWHYVREKSGKRKEAAAARWAANSDANAMQMHTKCNASAMHLGGGGGGGGGGGEGVPYQGDGFVKGGYIGASTQEATDGNPF